MNKKGFFILKVFSILFIFTFLSSPVYSLRVSPAKISFNFQPNFHQNFEYKVSGTSPDKVLELYTGGDLAKYITLSKKKLKGGGTFVASLNLPAKIETPGKHRILIGVKEIVNEKDLEVIGATIGTSVTINSVIDVYVPYPGKYLELFFKTSNVNAGEPVKFELDIKNMGKENVFFKPQINIYSGKKEIETLYLKERNLNSGEQIKLQKFLNTSDYNPGTYNAVALVDYGSLARAESEFKIGHLFIDIINYTEKIPIGGLQKFDLNVQSDWNEKIDGAYAEVSFLNNSKEIANFKTTSTSLAPWESRTITGFFDTSNFTEADYNANITLYYYGKNKGESTSKIAVVKFFNKEKQKIPIIMIVIGGIFLLLIIFILIKYLHKNEKKN